MATTHASGRHERLVAVGLIVAFALLVAGALGSYLFEIGSVHERIRALLPAVLGSVRMPGLRPAELVVAAAIALVTIAFLGLLIHDARQATPPDAPQDAEPQA